MNKDNFYSLGKITKTSGYKGSLMFFFDVDNIHNYKDLSSLFIKIDNNFIPFFIEELSIKSPQKAFVKLQGVDDQTRAENLVNYKTYLSYELLHQDEKDRLSTHRIIGYQVVDTHKGAIGELIEIQDQGAQSIFVIVFNEKEILIPLHEDFIQKEDHAQKILYLDTPEGLIDLYIE